MEGVGEGLGAWGPCTWAQDSQLRAPLASPHPGDPPGSSQTRGAPIPAGLGLGRRAGVRGDSVEAEAAARDPSLATHGFAQGASNNHRALKRKKKKNTDLVSFCFQSGQGERRETGAGVPHTIRGTSGSQAEPLPAEGGGYRPHPAPKGSPSWHGWARRGRGGAEGAPGWAEPPIPVFHPASPGPPPQIRLRVV